MVVMTDGNIRVNAGGMERSSLAQRLGGGLVAGLVAGTVLLFLLMLAHAAGGQDPLVALKVAAYPFLGSRVLAPGLDGPAVALGVVGHYFVSAVWGVLFAALVTGFSRQATVWLGALFGVFVWLGMFLVVLPVFAPELARGAGSLGLALTHVVFGVALGVALLPFQRSDVLWRPSWRSHPAAHS